MQGTYTRLKCDAAYSYLAGLFCSESVQTLQFTSMERMMLCSGIQRLFGSRARNVWCSQLNVHLSPRRADSSSPRTQVRARLHGAAVGEVLPHILSHTGGSRRCRVGKDRTSGAADIGGCFAGPRHGYASAHVACILPAAQRPVRHASSPCRYGSVRGGPLYAQHVWSGRHEVPRRAPPQLTSYAAAVAVPQRARTTRCRKATRTSYCCAADVLAHTTPALACE